MIFSVCSSLAAIRAYSVKMGVHANNVANADTEEYKKQRAVLEEGPRNDVQVEIKQVDTPGPSIADVTDGQIETTELANVDLAEEIPQTILTERGFEANFVTLRTMDEMIGSVIDILE
jgi:flagellar hook protein FlgE